MLLAILGYSIVEIAIAIIIIAGVIAVVYLILGALGIQIPPIAIKLFWIVFAVCAGIFAIRLIASM